MLKGLFITFEGGENTGKSTQIQLLYKYLVALDYSVIVTREPGGTSGAESIRQNLLHNSSANWSHLSELLLFYTARNDLIEKVISPALEANKIVLCDRFFDSSHAYQNVLKKEYAYLFENLDRSIIRRLPDRSYFFHMTHEQWLERQKVNKHPDFFEQKSFADHEKILMTFHERAKAYNTRCRIIDATLDIEIIRNILIKDIEFFLHDKPLAKAIKY